MITAGIDQSEETVQPGGWSTPTSRRKALIGPYSGLNSMFHTWAVATIEVM